MSEVYSPFAVFSLSFSLLLKNLCVYIGLYDNNKCESYRAFLILRVRSRVLWGGCAKMVMEGSLECAIF